MKYVVLPNDDWQVTAKEIQFAPSRQGRPLSKMWKVWAEGEEVYASCGAAGNTSRISVHSSGRIQMDMGGRGVQVLAPPLSLTEGLWHHAFELRFLIGENTHFPPPERLEGTKALLVELPPAALFLANLLIVREGGEEAGIPIGFGTPVVPLWRASLSRERTAVLIGRVGPMTDANRGELTQLRRIVNPGINLRTKAAKPPYLETLRVSSHPQKGNVISIVPMGDEGAHVLPTASQHDQGNAQAAVVHTEAATAADALPAPDGVEVRTGTSGKKVFISYARKASIADAQALHDALGDDVCFLDLEDIEPDQQFPARIADAILGASVAVVIATPAYFERWYCLREWMLLTASGLHHTSDSITNERYDHLVVARGEGLKDSDMLHLPPIIQTSNLLRSNQTSELVHLVNQRLASSPQSIESRLHRDSVSPELVKQLVGSSVLPLPPGKTTRIPMYPLNLRPSLGDAFVGRVDDFWRLHEALSIRRMAPADVSVSTVALYAGGGYGKTQLATEYLRRVGPKLFRGGLLWLDASGERQSLSDQFRGILENLGYEGTDLQVLGEDGLRNTLARRLHEIDPATPVLYVVDNLPEPSGDSPMRELSEYCPGLDVVTCLVTSRIRTTRLLTLKLDVLSEESAVTMLCRGDVRRHELKEEEWREIGDWVGRLPLALELLNTALQDAALSPRQVLARVRDAEVSGELDRITASIKGDLPPSASRGIADAFGVSTSLLPSAARELAFCCAWLSSAPIPRAILTHLASNDDGAVSSLVRRSFLVTIDGIGDSFQMHRVLNSFLRDVQSDTGSRLQRVFESVSSWFKVEALDQPELWTAQEALAPHAATLVQHLWRTAVRDDERVSCLELLHVMERFGRRTGRAAFLDSALMCARRLVSDCIETKEALWCAHLRSVLGGLLVAAGERTPGKLLYEEAVEQYRLALIDRDVSLEAWAIGQANLASGLSHLGHYDLGDAQATEALQASEAALGCLTSGAQPVVWARAQLSRGHALLLLGRHENTSARLEQAIDTFRIILTNLSGDPSSEAAVLSAKFGLISALVALGERDRGTVRLREALKYCRELEAVTQKAREPMRWADLQAELGLCLWLLASREWNDGEFDNAIAHLSTALETFTFEHFPKSWASIQGRLASAWWTAGLRRHDVGMMERCAAAYEAIALATTRTSAPIEWGLAQIWLGKALRILGSWRKAPDVLAHSEAALLAALDIFTKDKTPLEWTHAKTDLGMTLYRIGEVTGDVNAFERSIAPFKDALTARSKSHLPNDWAMTHEELARSLIALGSRKRDVNILHQARESLQAALEVFTETYHRQNWASLQEQQGRYFSALADITGNGLLLKESVVAFEAALRVYTAETMPVEWAIAQYRLGEVLSRLGEAGADRQLILRAIAELARVLESGVHVSGRLALDVQRNIHQAQTVLATLTSQQ